MVASITLTFRREPHARSAQNSRLTEWKGRVRERSLSLGLASNKEANHPAPAGFFLLINIDPVIITIVACLVAVGCAIWMWKD